MTFPNVILGTLNLKNYDTLRSIVEVSSEIGFKAYDTAPSYQTEEVLGRVVNDMINEGKFTRSDLFISDKVDAWQMQETNGQIQKYLYSALKKMNLDYIDQYLIHWPIPEFFEETWKSMEKLYEEGVVKKIGVSNIRVGHLKRMESYQHICPHFVQIERHPLRTCENEMMYCKSHQIKVEAYSPLCRMNEKIKQSELLQSLKEKYHKNDIGQIVLKWHLQTGSIPVFTTRSPQRIVSNLNIFDFQLSDEEISQINQMNCNYKIFLESTGCPGYENW